MEVETHSDRLLSTAFDRRELLRAGALGVATLGLGGLAPLAEALMVPTTAKNEKEFRTRLMALGGLSLRSAQLGQQKATNPDLKTFAGFEADEQTQIAKVLKELKTPMLPPDPDAEAIVRRHEEATGAEFDKVFARSQLEVHQMLLALGTSFLENSRGKGMAETHARHLAMVSGATIRQHIAQTTAYVAELNA